MIAPGATIGILGGGQLGRMLAQAAAAMGYHSHIYCPDPDSPAFEVCDARTVAAYDDRAALQQFGDAVDIVTYEFENIPAAPLSVLKDKLFPDVTVLETCQHRIREKEAISRFGVKTAPFTSVTSQAELKTAIDKIGLPAVLKTAMMGYDGKGQWKIDDDRNPDEQMIRKIFSNSGSSAHRLIGSSYILEGFVDFRMEISVIVARDAKGEMACYVPVQNIHRNHILAETIVPAPISTVLAKEAEGIARKIAQGLKLVGILAVEMFVTNDDRLLVNELAPRPHNSGHWTLDAAQTSQFEQTIRAICGLPLGPAKRTHDARMINLIGDEIKDAQKYVAMPGAKVHLYGKKETRPGRKMGHVTFLVPGHES